MQPADDDHYYFSFLTNKIDNKQIKCGMTYTNNEVHKIISDNISRSAMYSGNIKGVGHAIVLPLKIKLLSLKKNKSIKSFSNPKD